MMVVESPKRRLHREMGWPMTSWSRRPASSWETFHTGEIVHRVDDPRHEGRVGAVNSSIDVVVYWWVEHLQAYALRETVAYDQLRRVK